MHCVQPMHASLCRLCDIVGGKNPPPPYTGRLLASFSSTHRSFHPDGLRDGWTLRRIMMRARGWGGAGVMRARARGRVVRLHAATGAPNCPGRARTHACWPPSTVHYLDDGYGADWIEQFLNCCWQCKIASQELPVRCTATPGPVAYQLGAHPQTLPSPPPPSLYPLFHSPQGKPLVYSGYVDSLKIYLR